MKELKFRAWINNYNCYADVLGFEQGRLFVQFQSGERSQHRLYVPIEDCALEQYTGLKDKNGKEIYEGDLVDDGYSRICKIRWSEHFTAFEAINKNDGYVSNIWFVSKYGEVIGNIHENADLLEEICD